MSKLSDEILSKAADALRRGDASKAVGICLIAGRRFFDAPSLIDEIDIVLTRTPQVLVDCPDHILRPVRVAAGLMLLTGGSSIRRFIATDGDCSYRYKPESVAHLLVSHAAYLIRRECIAHTGIKNVQILDSGLPDEYSVCREISQRRFAVADASELPIGDCTCPDGCKCVLIAVA
jgi:hypothetical protein